MNKDIYSFYNSICTSEKCKSINKNLESLYREWHKNVDEKFKDNIYEQKKNKKNNEKKEFIIENYSPPIYLFCSDAYLKCKNKIMIIAKEAHDSDKFGINGFNELYLKDSWGSVNYINKIINNKTKQSLFLKTRKLISNIRMDQMYEEDDLKNKLCSVLINNVNKTSPLGQSVNCKITKPLFNEFTFNNEKEKNNIFWHEINLLKPKKIILLIGNDYKYQIKAAFKNMNNDLDKVFTNNIISMSDGIKKLTKKIDERFIVNNHKFEILWTFHPNARFNSEQRKYYEQTLNDFTRDC